MNNNFWTIEGWGSDYPPINADEIINAVNDYLSEIDDDYEQGEASSNLWEKLCNTGSVLGINAVYEDCDE